MSERRYALPRVFYTGDIKATGFSHKVRLNPVRVAEAMRANGYSPDEILNTDVVIDNRPSSERSQPKKWEKNWKRIQESDRMTLACDTANYASRFVAIRNGLRQYARGQEELRKAGMRPRDGGYLRMVEKDTEQSFVTKRLLPYLAQQGDTERSRKLIDSLTVKRVRTEMTADLMGQIVGKANERETASKKWQHTKLLLASYAVLSLGLTDVVSRFDSLDTQQVSHLLGALVLAGAISLNSLVSFLKTSAEAKNSEEQRYTKQLPDTLLGKTREWSNMMVFDAIPPRKTS